MIVNILKCSDMIILVLFYIKIVFKNRKICINLNGRFLCK